MLGIVEVLAINCGSSTLKFRVLAMETEQSLLAGSFELDAEGAPQRLQLERPDPGAAAEQEDCNILQAGPGQKFSRLRKLLEDNAVFTDSGLERLVVHRVVAGGEQSDPIVISDSTRERIRQAIPLAPLHNPAALEGIDALGDLYPDLPQVAVFDTGFHATMPERACRYTLPQALGSPHPIRRFGYHGISHEFVARQATGFLSPASRPRRLITLHLGSGASAAAIVDGRCIDTSMGMTPLEGLVMATRSGDVDPGIGFYLARELGMEAAEIERLYNEESGLKGLCGSADMREVVKRADSGETEAQFAIELYCYRICKTVGAYHVALGGLDCLVFTAGIGENTPLIRQRTIEGLSALGARLDAQANENRATGIRLISAEDSAFPVLVVPTDEELHMARIACTVAGAGQ